MRVVEYRIGEEHFLAFGLLTARKSFRICLSLFGGYLILVLALIALVGGSEALWCVVAFMAILILMLCLNRFRALPRLLQASYREDVAIKEPTMLTYDAEGYLAEYGSGRNRRKWAELVKWDENDQIFAVFSNRMMGHIFPKDQIATDVIDDIRNHLVASGLSQQGKLRQ